MNVKAAPIIIMAGGTGGHVYPGLAVADYLRTQNIPVCWMGTKGGLEARVVPAAGIKIVWIHIKGLRGKGLLNYMLAPFRIVHSVFQALGHFRSLRPRAVLGMGGFVSGPGGLAALILGIPVLVHEQNSIPGLTNRVLSKFARKTLQGFPDTFVRGITVGNPVRSSIAALPMPEERFADHFGQARLLIIGGSLGATFFNQQIPQALALIAQSDRPLVRHQSGTRHVQQTETAYAKAGVIADIQPFIEDMAEVYAWADIAICRSGALTIAELTAVGLGAILIPYPYAVDDHQTCNGQFLSRNRAACLLPQNELSAQSLAQHLQEFLTDRIRMLDMANKARALAFPNATRNVAHACIQEARG